jgi:EAL domain-containing protein (putative c-di-GMP-specific phosphodiesterase class I)
MLMPAKTPDRLSRVNALRSTRSLQNASEPFYDAITRLTANLFGVPNADILLIDDGGRGHASRDGVERDLSLYDLPICQETLRHAHVTVLADAAQDPRFQDDPLVTGPCAMRFYAGVPLVGSDGRTVGLLCAFGPTPRHDVTCLEIDRLGHLASVASEHLNGIRSAVYQDPVTALPSLLGMIEDVQCLLQGSDIPQKLETYAVLADVYSLADISHLVIASGVLAISQVAINSAARLKAVLPPDITLYRVGYARYIFFRIGKYCEIAELTQRCLAAFDTPLTVAEAVPIDLTPHIGIVKLGPTSDAFDLLSELIAISEEARRLRLPTLLGNASFTNKTRRTFEIINSVKFALQAEPAQFRLVYQPVIDLRQQAVTKFEALIRWNHPTLGELMPSEFLPLIESTALMPRLTMWVVDAASKQLAQWGDAASHIKIAVNIAAGDLTRDDLAADLANAMRVHGVATDRLECEVTETALISSFEQGMKNINAVRQLGIAISIDDFGAGYSNLAYLQRVPVDALKIDQSLVRSISDNSRDATIVRAAISLAHELGYKVTIEGVETSAILALVEGWGAECAQGYTISRPLEADNALQWMRDADERAGSGSMATYGRPSLIDSVL